MKKSDFYYNLPEELIAYYPAKCRVDSRLLILDRISGEVKHKVFTDLLDYFKAGDVLLLNNTKVIPARIYGNRKSGAKVEVFLVSRVSDDSWEVLLNPSARIKKGEEIIFGSDFTAILLDFPGKKTRKIKFNFNGNFWNILNHYGKMPLPPYIKRKADESDKTKYQTVYAKKKGAVAAPTAGLHFTEDLINSLKTKGVDVVFVTLHVGYGTFSPIKVENITEHKMHSEYFEITEEAAHKLNQAKSEGRRVIACGTTSVRAVESSLAEDNTVLSAQGNTNIFIYPKYKFKIIDGLITNFHLPESTLLMLVAAFCGKENVLNAYNKAIDSRYRFFSYGDAMLII